MQFSAIRRMAAVIERPGMISFAPGQPSPETFPVADFSRLLARVTEADGAMAFQYTSTRGLAELVSAVRAYAADREMPAEPSEALVTEGSQQGIDLISRVLLDPGDVALVEVPSYIGATSAFRAAQARMVGVRLDEAGIDLEELRRHHDEATDAGQPVKLLYATPNFQNPSGISYTAERRTALVELASELDLLIVEDDPYGDLYFDTPPPPTLKSLDRDGRVVYVSSFSKILAPGLRAAFMLGPRSIVAKVEIAKQAANLCGSSLDQRLVLSCLKEGLIETQKARIRPYYGRKRDVLLAALEEHMPAGVAWTRPGGGMFVWVTLPMGFDATALLESAVQAGVAYVPGAPFCVDGSGANSLRMTFAREGPEKIVEGVRRLARVIRERLG
jgi:2-aminoadipate transaminase